MPTKPLWKPSDLKVKNSQLYKFACNLRLSDLDYDSIHEWSIEHNEEFWKEVWQFCGVEGNIGSNTLSNPVDFIDSQWFPEASLNFAENLLKFRDNATALIAVNEKKERRECSYQDLYERASKFACYLRSIGIEAGDRVVSWLPNTIETVVAMLGTTSIGAVWSSCSPDFGVEGALDRFGQIEPKVLIAVKSYQYNGRIFDVEDNVRQVANNIPSIQHTIWFDPDHPDDFDRIDETTAEDFEFCQFPFDHPLYIMYSSGTTGKPKCIVHGAGGTLLQHLKEHRLHVDLTRKDTLFFFTTTGWMMWNWLVSALATGCKVILFDGAPFHPKPHSMLRYIEKEQISVFGVGAKYISSLEKFKVVPSQKYDLSSLRSILSTGSPLSHESYRYVYKSVKEDVWLASISGGTDLISCFVLGNPLSPVYEGQIQGPGLGMAVDVLDSEGKPVKDQRGELVCKSTFPSKPLYFWEDENNERYTEAYFSTYGNIWNHGDFAEIDSETGGYLIHGRSDAVLNPGGVRIGTAEIYRQIEGIQSVKDAVCVGQEWRDDTRVILFVVMQDGFPLTSEVKTEIKQRIRAHASPRHVPSKIIAVNDIPITRSGKLAEIAVREAIHGREVKNTTALANPESLAEYVNLAELAR